MNNDDISRSTLKIVRNMKRALVRDSILAFLLCGLFFWLAVKVNIINYVHKFGYQHQFYETDMVVNFLFASFMVFTIFSFARFIEMIRFFKVMLNISRHDYLTRVYNRRALIELLEMEFVRNQRVDDGHFAFILFDLDDFKGINDCHGHAMGDLVLKTVGETLLSSVRRSDITGRFGGDEFAIILPYTDLDNAIIVGDKIREKVSALKFSSNNKTVSVSLSLGIIEVKHGSGIDTFEKVIAEADKYLYCAKQRGKNQICTKYEINKGSTDEDAPEKPCSCC